MLKKIQEAVDTFAESRGEDPSYIIMNPYSYNDLLAEVYEDEEDWMLKDLHQHKGLKISVTTNPNAPDFELAI